jgi:hypothetical protein
MEIVTTVINPIDNEEVEVTLKVNVRVSVTDEIKILSVDAFGSKEV